MTGDAIKNKKNKKNSIARDELDVITTGDLGENEKN